MFRAAPSRRAILGASLILTFAVAGFGPALAHDFEAGGLRIKHPWSRATAPAAKVAGGYFTVVNTSSTPDRLVAATAEIAERSELHEMVVKDGVMSMRAVAGGVEIPAHGELVLEPGSKGSGYHLMFMGLKKPLMGGEKFAGTLTFEKAGTIAVEFAVEGMGASGHGDHSQHGG